MLRSRFQFLSTSRGSALVLVLVVLAVCAALITLSQTLLVRRATELSLDAARVELRGTLLLSLQTVCERWAMDEDPALDHPGEAWAQPLDLRADNGVAVRVTLQDAQDRYNLNNLGVEILHETARPPFEIVAELLLRCGHFHDALLLARVADWIDPDTDGGYEEDWYKDQNRRDRPVNRPLYSLGELRGLDPGVDDWLRPRPPSADAVQEFEANFSEETNALPTPDRRVTTVNLNTARPAVLLALVGEAQAAWVDTVLQARAREPLRDPEFVVRLLPEPLRTAVGEAVDVRTDYVQVTARAYFQNVPMEMSALLHRTSDGSVEVVQCQW